MNGYNIPQPPQYTTSEDLERASKLRTKDFNTKLTLQEREAAEASGMPSWQTLMLGIELGGGLTQAEVVLLRQAANSRGCSVSAVVKVAVLEYIRNHQDRH